MLAAASRPTTIQPDPDPPRDPLQRYWGRAEEEEESAPGREGVSVPVFPDISCFLPCAFDLGSIGSNVADDLSIRNQDLLDLAVPACIS